MTTIIINYIMLGLLIDKKRFQFGGLVGVGGGGEGGRVKNHTRSPA